MIKRLHISPRVSIPEHAPKPAVPHSSKHSLPNLSIRTSTFHPCKHSLFPSSSSSFHNSQSRGKIIIIKKKKKKKKTHLKLEVEEEISKFLKWGYSENKFGKERQGLISSTMPVRRYAFGRADEATHPDSMRAALAEFVATFIFVFAGEGSILALGIFMFQIIHV